MDLMANLLSPWPVLDRPKTLNANAQRARQTIGARVRLELVVGRETKDLYDKPTA